MHQLCRTLHTPEYAAVKSSGLDRPSVAKSERNRINRLPNVLHGIVKNM